MHCRTNDSFLYQVTQREGWLRRDQMHAGVWNRHLRNRHNVMTVSRSTAILSLQVCWKQPLYPPLWRRVTLARVEGVARCMDQMLIKSDCTPITQCHACLVGPWVCNQCCQMKSWMSQKMLTLWCFWVPSVNSQISGSCSECSNTWHARQSNHVCYKSLDTAGCLSSIHSVPLPY